MNQLPDFADSSLARPLVAQICALASRCGEVNIMEVCGSHTMAIAELGLRHLLPENVRLLSGPGCPVCVTPAEVIDATIACSLEHGATVLTFGDMVRVPGSVQSLQQVKAAGGKVDVVSSPMQALGLAEASPETNYIFIAVGFETTIPAVALAVQKAVVEGIKNLTFLVSHRLVPPALELLVNDPDLKLSGMIAPGHVSAILGEAAYDCLRAAGIPAVIAGFEPLDILSGLYELLQLIEKGGGGVKNRYARIVRPEGNPHAVALIDRFFEPVDALWRGIGTLPKSGLALRPEFEMFDAVKRFGLRIAATEANTGCRCGHVLLGHILPDECPLFGTACTPDHPVGACMVSGEGSCAAYFKYNKGVPA